MIILCPQCSTPYKLPGSQVSALVQVACPSCAHAVILDFEAANEPSLREPGHRMTSGFLSEDDYRQSLQEGVGIPAANRAPVESTQPSAARLAAAPAKPEAPAPKTEAAPPKAERATAPTKDTETTDQGLAPADAAPPAPAKAAAPKVAPAPKTPEAPAPSQSAKPEAAPAKPAAKKPATPATPPSAQPKAAPPAFKAPETRRPITAPQAPPPAAAATPTRSTPSTGANKATPKPPPVHPAPPASVPPAARMSVPPAPPRLGASTPPKTATKAPAKTPAKTPVAPAASANASGGNASFPDLGPGFGDAAPELPPMGQSTKGARPSTIQFDLNRPATSKDVFVGDKQASLGAPVTGPSGPATPNNNFADIDDSAPTQIQPSFNEMPDQPAQPSASAMQSAQSEGELEVEGKSNGLLWWILALILLAGGGFFGWSMM